MLASVRSLSLWPSRTLASSSNLRTYWLKSLISFSFTSIFSFNSFTFEHIESWNERIWSGWARKRTVNAPCFCRKLGIMNLNYSLSRGLPSPKFAFPLGCLIAILPKSALRRRQQRLPKPVPVWLGEAPPIPLIAAKSMFDKVYQYYTCMKKPIIGLDLNPRYWIPLISKSLHFALALPKFLQQLLDFLQFGLKFFNDTITLHQFMVQFRHMRPQCRQLLRGAHRRGADSSSGRTVGRGQLTLGQGRARVDRAGCRAGDAASTGGVGAEWFSFTFQGSQLCSNERLLSAGFSHELRHGGSHDGKLLRVQV